MGIWVWCVVMWGGCDDDVRAILGWNEGMLRIMSGRYDGDMMVFWGRCECDVRLIWVWCESNMKVMCEWSGGDVMVIRLWCGYDVMMIWWWYEGDVKGFVMVVWGWCDGGVMVALEWREDDEIYFLQAVTPSPAPVNVRPRTWSNSNHWPSPWQLNAEANSSVTRPLSDVINLHLWLKCWCDRHPSLVDL